MKQKTIEDKYKKLTDIEHILLRPGMYIGSIVDADFDNWYLNPVDNRMVYGKLNYNPGFVKLFDEIVSNSVDEHKRNKKLNMIKVNIDRDKGIIKVWDNGGIPVEIHKEHKQYVPEMIFGDLKAGSNFDDTEERTATGTNGLGAKLNGCFSTYFKVTTADNKNRFEMVWTNNSRNKTKPVITPITQHFTEIEYHPDFTALKTSFTDGNYLKLVKRVYDVAGCNPNINVFLNDEHIKIKSFRQYIGYFHENAVANIIYTEQPNWKIGVGSSDGQFSSIAYVNGAETPDEGSSHVSYIANQLINGIREYIEKKHKIEIRPSNIKQYLKVFIDATIVNPMYSSQTKEKLITDERKFGSICEIDDKVIKQIIESDVVQKIIDWVKAKEMAAEQAELRKLSKDVTKVNPKSIIKLCDANEKLEREKCSLYIAEGDSASKCTRSVGDKRLTGTLPLKGKIPNVSELKASEILENDEIKNIIIALGLTPGVKVNSIKDLRYGKIVILTDQDCLGKDTMVMMADRSYKAISEILPGDMVIGGSGNVRKVTNVIETMKSHYFKCDINGQEVISSLDHKFIVKDRRLVAGFTTPFGNDEWVIEKAQNIMVHKHIVKSEFGNEYELTNKKICKADITLFDITVEEDHTFYVKCGDTNILMKNCDGAGHITGLLLNLFHRFWPELFDLGAIYRFVTPLIKVYKNDKDKSPIEFFSISEYEKWKAKHPDKKGNIRYFKGLGGHKTEDFKSYLSNINNYLYQFKKEDVKDDDLFDLCFSQGKGKADARKVWLDIVE